MAARFLNFFRECCFGPNLYRGYEIEDGEADRASLGIYTPNIVESATDFVLKIMSFGASNTLNWYITPPLILYLYYKGSITRHNCQHFARLSGYMMAFYASIYVLRGAGRFTNSDYLAFIETLTNCKVDHSDFNKMRLSKYDFDFTAWPVGFHNSFRHEINLTPPKLDGGNLIKKIITFPYDIFSYYAAHTFGRRMIYPGSLSTIQAMLKPFLSEGRRKLIEEHNGIREKLLTADGNEIDTVFIDNRKIHHHKLVICCEGNAGFLEHGIINTPLQAGYSVIGWNHPGFGGSTGVPSPQSEINAIDAVMQYAISLEFEPKDIILYGWSIGAFPASWATKAYPRISGLILDAPFDNLIVLATSRMPKFLKGFTINLVEKYFNLNVSENLLQYSGPVRIIRRINDEIMNIHNSIKSNRGNFLLINLLQSRYPNLIDGKTLPTIKGWLATFGNNKDLLYQSLNIDNRKFSTIIDDYIMAHGELYPLDIGENMILEDKICLAIYLANTYLSDFDASHNTPLPAHKFKAPTEYSQNVYY